MMLRVILFCLVLASASAAEAAPQPRMPTGKWIVDFADAQCVASRDYGSQGGALRLVLKAPPLGEVMHVAVVRGGGGSTQPAQVDATVAVDKRRPLKTGLTMFYQKESKQRIYLLNMPSAEFAVVRQAKTFSVRSDGLDEAFALSQMEGVLKVMDRCVADLRRVFNIPPAGTEPAGLRTRAKAEIYKYFSSSDYPAVAIRNYQAGKVKFALLIQEDGRVADCTVVETSGVPSLDTQACAMLKARVRFEPARDLDGKPAKDAVFGAIDWRMP